MLIITHPTMNKVIPILSLLLLLSSFAFAGKGGPDAYGYTWIDSDDPSGPNFAWWDVTAFAGEVSAPLRKNGTEARGLGRRSVLGRFYGMRVTGQPSSQDALHQPDGTIERRNQTPDERGKAGP